MPLYLTGYHSSRVRKPVASSLRRSTSSPFAHLPRTKTGQRTKSSENALEDEDDGGRLDTKRKALPATAISPTKTVLDSIQHATLSMFCEVPERSGMNSTRIAEVLNFRKGLPSVVSIAHVHGLVTASTQTERDIVTLIQSGKIRKIKIIGRGNDLGGLSEVLITTSELESMLRRSKLTEGAVDEFLDVLRLHPKATAFSPSMLPMAHLSALIKAGFLVSASLYASGISRGNSLGGSSTVAPPTISRAASGSWAAVGGGAAFEDLGGVGIAKRHNSDAGRLTPSGNEMMLSLPSIGTYLRLLYNARSHLLDLLGKSKYREAPLYLLRERWDGAVDSENRVSAAKRIRGEFSGILPGKTKKWKDLYGLSFDWTLEECLGAGLVELFETGSVGYGVRAL